MSTLKLKGSSSGEAQVTVAAAAGTPTITLPTASINLATAGSDGQFLKTNGSGTLSFATVSVPADPAMVKLNTFEVTALAVQESHRRKKCRISKHSTIPL